MTFTKEAIKRHAISLGITFISSFFLIVGFQISNPDFVFTTDAIRSVALAGLISATRAVGKLVYELASQTKA